MCNMCSMHAVAHVLEAYMLHMNNCTHSACMYYAHLVCLYVACMWRVSIFVYAAHMPYMCSMYAVCMPNMCSKVTGMYAVYMQHVCSMYTVYMLNIKVTSMHAACIHCFKYTEAKKGLK